MGGVGEGLVGWEKVWVGWVKVWVGLVKVWVGWVKVWVWWVEGSVTSGCYRRYHDGCRLLQLLLVVL